MTLASHEGTAFGTVMQVVVTNPDHLERATSAVERVVEAIDVTCSRFRDDSELSILLAGAGRHESAVSETLGQAIATALRAAELTDGAVDPTVGGAVRNAGYTVDFGALAPDGAPISLTVHPVPGWRRITYSPATRIVEIPAGIEVDLGATAKALASDLAAEAASDALDGAGVLVSLGGDVAVAGMPPEDGWHVQIAENSHAPITRDGETIAIRSGGVATSSTTVRRWRRGGVELHHIIDPATGQPAIGPWRTVSVVAGNCVDANIAATAAIVRGFAAMAWLEVSRAPGAARGSLRRNSSGRRVAAGERSGVLSDERLHLTLIAARVVVHAVGRDARVSLVVAGERCRDVRLVLVHEMAEEQPARNDVVLRAPDIELRARDVARHPLPGERLDLHHPDRASG